MKVQKAITVLKSIDKNKQKETDCKDQKKMWYQ